MCADSRSSREGDVKHFQREGKRLKHNDVCSLPGDVALTREKRLVRPRYESAGFTARICPHSCCSGSRKLLGCLIGAFTVYLQISIDAD